MVLDGAAIAVLGGAEQPMEAWRRGLGVRPTFRTFFRSPSQAEPLRIFLDLCRRARHPHAGRDGETRPVAAEHAALR